MIRQQLGAGFARRAFSQDEQGALVALLALPDPPEMVRRGHRVVQQGDPRKQKALLRYVVRVFIAKHTLALDAEAVGEARIQRRRRRRPAQVIPIERLA